MFSRVESTEDNAPVQRIPQSPLEQRESVCSVLCALASRHKNNQIQIVGIHTKLLTP